MGKEEKGLKGREMGIEPYLDFGGILLMRKLRGSSGRRGGLRNGM
jgi:hypothetical protein